MIISENFPAQIRFSLVVFYLYCVVRVEEEMASSGKPIGSSTKAVSNGGSASARKANSNSLSLPPNAKQRPADAVDLTSVDLNLRGDNPEAEPEPRRPSWEVQIDDAVYEVWSDGCTARFFMFFFEEHSARPGHFLRLDFLVT